mmetsp:Transcript_136010/g.322281  ORF Transcript_136010/g.322281 Transcript_136010/m.322281 type:complete len:109 (+) Transcript_136010:59-385(+)
MSNRAVRAARAAEESRGEVLASLLPCLPSAGTRTSGRSSGRARGFDRRRMPVDMKLGTGMTMRFAKDAVTSFITAAGGKDFALESLGQDAKLDLLKPLCLGGLLRPDR